MSNIIAIVGRPNVGKSTFFNRLTGSRQAIVDPTSGVTRDRHYGTSDWNGIAFSVIDTGGYVSDSGDVFEKEIQRQVNLAIEEADAIIFMVDAHEGLTTLDEDVATMLRQSGKPMFLVVNKVDVSKKMGASSEFYELGIDPVYIISSVNGSGTGELLDAVVSTMTAIPEEEVPDLPRLAVIGRPNVGKSSLVNALLGHERNIVTPVAGTTRDSIYTPFKGFESQDLSILHLAEKNHKGLVMVVNKWDLVEKETNTTKDYEALIRAKTAPFKDYPIIFTSIPKKQRIIKAMEKVQEVHENRQRKISTSK